MNACARYIRLMSKRRQREAESEPAADQSSNTDAFEEDPELDEMSSEAMKEFEESMQDYDEARGPTETYTAEIDVELSDSDHEEQNKDHGQKEEENLDLSSSDTLYEYVGNPNRQVKVPQFAMYTALQRTRPELVARTLIRFIFPEDVLVVSNVYGSADNGILALDPNRIAALREHLQERFSWLKLKDDGPDWRVCVAAINSTIRKIRYDRKINRRKRS